MVILAAAVAAASMSGRASAANTASDNAANSAYTVYTAFANENGGTGFGPWAVTITGTGGDYINGATYDNTGVVTAPNFDIWNDTNDGAGGGTYGVDVTTATRPFTGGALSANQIFKFSDVLHYANQTQGGGSALGWALQDSAGNTLFDFHTAGGAAGYFLSDANNSDTVETTVPYNYQTGDTFAFELNDASGDYTLTVTSAPNGNVMGGSQTFTGQISMASGGPSQFAAYNNNGEGGSDIEFNNLAITSLAAPQQWITNGSGDWNNGANWNGIIPNAVGAEADFFGAITANHTVYTDQAVTVGTINFNNTNTYEITGTGSLTLQASTGSAEVIVQNGTQEINLPTTIASNTIFNVAGGSTLVIADPLTINSGKTLTTSGNGTVNYESIVNILGGGVATFSNSTHAYQLSVAATAKANLSSPTGGTVLEVNNLSNSGTVNVANNTLIVNYSGGADPIATIRAELISGYANGGWNGAGIDSTSAAARAGTYALGYADSADPGNPAGLASGTIEIKYTLMGDANLDGKVNGADFAILATNFNKAINGSSGWDEGDFNYDGKINGADFAALAANFNKGASTSADISALDEFAAVNGLSASVPEPATAGLAILGAVGALARRRRGSGN
jgi:hypothetical protein